MVLEVHGDLMFTLDIADTVGGRLGDLGNLCGPIELRGIEFSRCRPQHPERTDDLSVQAAQRLADAGPHRRRRFAHNVLIALPETERVRNDHRLPGFDDIDWHDRGVHRRDVVAVAHLRRHLGAEFEAEVRGLGVEQAQTDDRRIIGAVRGTLQRLDDRCTGLGGLQSRIELREIEGLARPIVTESTTGAVARNSRQPRRNPID